MSMDRKRFLTLSATFAAGAVCKASVGTALSKMSVPEKRNVVILFIDDLGYGDIGPFGCKDIPTPHLDRLANEGTKCTTSYITNPPCSPSRSSLMMGCYGQRFGKYGMARGLPIPEDRQTLARFMKDAGYVTGHIGKWDLGSKAQGPLNAGFDETRKDAPRRIYTDAELAELKKRVGDSPMLKKYLKKKQSTDFIINQENKVQWETDYDGSMMVDFVTRHKDQPFLLYFAPHAVHSPSIEAPPELTDRTRVSSGPRKFLAGAVVSVDDQVGRLLQVLEKHGLREKTLIIFSSDNGANEDDGGSSTPYSGGKGEGTQKEGWVRVPAIYSLPGVIPGGKTYAGITCSLDFYATAAALTGVPAPKHLDGVDMIPYLQGQRTGDAHEFLFWLNNDPTDEKRRHLVAVRWKDWRLYRYKETDTWQLFDLAKDPQEMHDVAAEHRDIVKLMETEFMKWKATLPPWKPIPESVRTGEPVIPEGYGWATASRSTAGK
ncbi:MAG: sulfatase-like hydrolase/transferase [Spirochaetes bacterium]|nr:sulfatase-like hydrolase/transferase [Spirochaetota bacterium]